MIKDYPFSKLMAFENFVFDNEVSFHKKFFNNEYMELHEIAFSSENVRVVLIAEEGQHLASSVDIKDFLVWVALVEEGK